MCDCEGWRPDRTCAGLELLQRAETAEAALLAKSAAYDALVARVEAAPVGQVRGAAVNASNEILEVALFGDRNQVPLLSRVRLLVSDDRPSHTAGEK